MRVVSRNKVYPAPKPGMSAYEYTYYARPTGIEKVRLRLLDISDDVPGERELAFSADNGKTWQDPLPLPPPRKVEGGTLRSWPAECFVDPVNGRQVMTALEGVFPRDSSDWGFKVYSLKYRVSEDGGRTALVEEPVIQRGCTPEKPVPGVWIGHNAFMTAAPHSVLRLPDGRLLMAICKSVLGPDGKLHNPGGSFSWLEVLILFGNWRDDGRIEWEAGPTLALGPDVSTRGLFEPTLALLPDNRLLMVMRGSNGGANDPHGKLPAHKWHSISNDGGRTWTAPQPWRYTDGTAFFSPSSYSQLLPHSDGKLYWIGNIDQANPNGNGTRDKLYLGEVDQQSLMLKKETLFLIAQRGPGEPPTQLSNFTAHEDRVTGEVVLHLPWFVEQGGKWGADMWVYRIALTPG